MRDAKRSRGFTLLQLVITVTIIGILAAIAVPVYQGWLERTRQIEALRNMEAIRRAELAKHQAAGTYVNAEGAAGILAALDLGVTERLFAYEVIDATQSTFTIIARRLASLGPAYALAMTPSGAFAEGPTPAAAAAAAAGAGGGSGGGSSGGGGSGGSSSGNSGSGGSGTGTGGSSGTGGGFSGSFPGIEGSPGDRPLVFIPRGADVWTNWPPVDTLNITGTDEQVETLTAAFDLVANSAALSITSDIRRRGTSLSFSDTSFVAGPPPGPCFGAIACFRFAFLSTDPPPNTPTPEPIIEFNPAYASEEPGVLAGVLVHEGTHLQTYLDGSVATLTTREAEFPAFWNEAVYWAAVRSSFAPFTTSLEREEENVYQIALQGEAAMVAFIAANYPP